MLAPFVDRSALTAIIGRDLFADPGQVRGFADLMSDEDKPFECVGERRESAVALRLLSERPEWRDSPVVSALAEQARGLVDDEGVRRLLRPDAAADAAAAGRLGEDVATAVRRFMADGS
jgi:hypothetical protein